MTEQAPRRLRDRLTALPRRYPIDEEIVLGLDVGIASTGWALIRHGASAQILATGSHCFEAPEEPKTKETKNKERRDSRLLRRVIRRRARRMRDVRELLVEREILSFLDPDEFHQRRDAPNPWQARAEGLDRKLSDEEFAAALLHIAKHRGFKSNSKRDPAENEPPGEKEKFKKAIESTSALLGRYKTIGQAFWKDPYFSERKRNRRDAYLHMVMRDDLRTEVKELFAAQQRFDNAKATDELRDRYFDIAFHQRPLQDSEDMVGFCPFEPEEMRSPRHAPSFEKFRFLAKLNTVKVREADGSLRRLTREELSKAIEDFGTSSKSVTWNALGKKIGLPKGVFFDAIDGEMAKKDVTGTRGAAAGTKTLYDAVGPAGWNAVKHDPALLDEVARVLSFREDLGRIETGLSEIDGLDPTIRKAVMDAARTGHFGTFTRAGHVSAKAARNILPHLLEGHVYSDACALAGYDHSRARRVELEDIRNPVVQRSLREAVNQTVALIHEFGVRPGRIIVELAREVGKSAEERDKITSGLEKRNAERERHRAEMKELLKLGRDPTDEELKRFELWKEQDYRCIYTGEAIPARNILSDATQVDHALPRSRSQDNSYANQVLCLTRANQDKGQRTPWEWKGHDDAWWDAFEARVNALKTKPYKKRLLKMRNFDERQKGFVERNLNDTKYAARALLSILREAYIDDDEPDPAAEGYLGTTKRRLFARPGNITAILRRAWGLDGVKDRADDRHHALDAMICAAARGEWLLNRLTRAYQEVEENQRYKWTPPVPRPWQGFRDDALAAYESVFVTRFEKRRGRGQGHLDTIYRVGEEDGHTYTYERKAVDKLTKGDLDRIKDAEGGNRPVVGALSAWLAAGKPADQPPRSSKGDPIKKVLLRRNKASGFPLNGGHVDNADMVRVDVFTKPNKTGKDEYYLVPVYRHQVMDPADWPEPPNQYVERGKPSQKWTNVSKEFDFKFSLYPDAYIRVISKNGELEEGYFRGLDVSVAGLNVSPHHLRQSTRKLGSKTASEIRKYNIDRLGRKHPVEREARTWHGAVCT